MRALIAFTLACLPMVAVATPAATAAADGLRISAALVARQPTIRVADPGNPAGTTRTVTPFELAPDLDTQLVWLQVRNEGGADVDVPPRGLRLMRAADGTEQALTMAEIKAPWGRYLSWATNPPHGNTLWFEREIAVRAEKYLDKYLFTGGTIPPGGGREGYVAFSRDGLDLAATGLQLELQKGEQVRAVTVPLAPGQR